MQCEEMLPPPADYRHTWIRLRGFWVTPEEHAGEQKECIDFEPAREYQCSFPGCIFKEKHAGPHGIDESTLALPTPKRRAGVPSKFVHKEELPAVKRARSAPEARRESSMQGVGISSHAAGKARAPPAPARASSHAPPPAPSSTAAFSFAKPVEPPLSVAPALVGPSSRAIAALATSIEPPTSSAGFSAAGDGLSLPLGWPVARKTAPMPPMLKSAHTTGGGHSAQTSKPRPKPAGLAGMTGTAVVADPAKAHAKAAAKVPTLPRSSGGGRGSSSGASPRVERDPSSLLGSSAWLLCGDPLQSEPEPEMPTWARVYVRLCGWWETPETLRRNRLWALEGKCGFPGCPLPERHGGPHQFDDETMNLAK